MGFSTFPFPSLLKTPLRLLLPRLSSLLPTMPLLLLPPLPPRRLLRGRDVMLMRKLPCCCCSPRCPSLPLCRCLRSRCWSFRWCLRRCSWCRRCSFPRGCPDHRQAEPWPRYLLPCGLSSLVNPPYILPQKPTFPQPSGAERACAIRFPYSLLPDIPK